MIQHICSQWFQEIKAHFENKVIQIWSRIPNQHYPLLLFIVTLSMLVIFVVWLLYHNMTSAPQLCDNVGSPKLSQSFDSISRFLCILAVNSRNQLEHVLIENLLPRFNCALESTNTASPIKQVFAVSELLMNKECLKIFEVKPESMDLHIHIEHMVLQVSWKSASDEVEARTDVVISNFSCTIRLVLQNDNLTVDCLPGMEIQASLSPSSSIKETDVEAIQDVLKDAILLMIKGVNSSTQNGVLPHTTSENKSQDAISDSTETVGLRRDSKEDIVQRRELLSALRPTSLSRISALQSIPEQSNSTGEDSPPSLRGSTSSDLSLTQDEVKPALSSSHPSDQKLTKFPQMNCKDTAMEGPSGADEPRTPVISSSSSLLMIPPPSRPNYSAYRKQQVWANVLKVTNIPVQENKNMQLVCVIEVKEPYQRCSTLPIDLVGRLYWDQNFLLEFNHNSSLLSIEVLCQKKKSKRLIYAGRQTIHRDEIQPRASEDQFRKVFRLQNVTPSLSPKSRSREDLVLPELIVEFRYLNNTSQQTHQLSLSQFEGGRITPKQQRPVSMLSVTSIPGIGANSNWNPKTTSLSRQLPALNVSRKFSRSEEEIDCFKKTIVRSSSFNHEVRIRPRRKGLLTLQKDVTFSRDVKDLEQDAEAEISLD